MPAGGKFRPGFRVRPYDRGDRARVREICADTGFLGNPIDPLFQDRELFNDFLTSPYTDAEPECCFVLENDHGEIEGYLTASKDPAKHGRFLRTRIPHWLGRAIRGFLFSYDGSSRRYLLWLIFSGWRQTPKKSKDHRLPIERKAEA